MESYVLADRVQSIFSVNAQAALKNCSVPISHFQGTKDHIVLRRNLSQTVKIRPDVRVYKFPTQHFLLQAAPVVAWEAIESFMGIMSRE